jgi:hypothetical protein
MIYLSPPPQLTDPATLAWLAERMRGDPEVSRYRLAKEICARLEWRDARGRPQEMASRKRLLALERQGAIVLPPPRRGPPTAGAAPPDPARTWPRFAGTLAELGTVSLQPLAGGTADSQTWNAMMAEHHPLGPARLCGAQFRYLIRSHRHGVLGGLAVSAAAWRLTARDSWLGWRDTERAANLQAIVCNSRFLILPSIQVKHLASHVLGQLARRIGPDWQQRYGITPWLMETCVEAARSGTAYRAANWIEVGMTAGRGRQDRAGKGGLAPKRVFLYPLLPRTLKRLCPNRAPSRPGWVHREFGGAKLGDARLQARLLDLGAAFFAQPQANIPQACGSPAAAKAAYRLFDNDRVSMDSLLEPHRQATADRMRREPLVLVAQDTTSLTYTTRPEMQGIGPIANKLDGPQGLLLHSAQAFTPQGLPLGILHMACWARDPAEFGKRAQCNAKPIEAKESSKWLQALGPIGAAAAQCPNTRVVVLSDRESDIYEYMLAAQQQGRDVVLRAREKQRGLHGEHLRLWPHLLLSPVAGTIELRVPRQGKQPPRIATMELRCQPVTLRPPAGKPGLPVVPVWAVLAREPNPPPEIKQPLEWLLLSSVPVTGLADAIERVQWYAVRWGIEVFHRVLKSGCKIEHRQLGTADRLEACLAIDAVVAWRIHHLTHLGRTTPDLPCTAVFEDDQWKAVVAFQTRQLPPAEPPSLRQMIRAVARLGGFLGRQADGEPGTQSLWRGLQRMDDITAAFRSFHTIYKLPH